MPNELEAKAVTILADEKAQWETGTAFITEKVAFQMRNLIRELRKNYWGVFTQPFDPVTQRRKTYVPLTESLVEAAVKNIDLDTKDITVKTKPGGRFGLVKLARSIIKNNLDKIRFGQILDDTERRLAIDGTCVWWTGKTNGKLDVRVVDLLNFYIDPTAPSIEETEAVIERIIMDETSAKKFAKSQNYNNVDDISGSQSVERYDGEIGIGNLNMRGETPTVEFWKRTGLTPKFLFTGNMDDEDLVMAEIVASGTNGPQVFHDIKRVPKKKPYNEFWYTKVPNRWYGKGVAEKVMALQIWMNTLVNIRINRHFVSQLGIFKIKRNRGITPQMVSKLAASGAITVDDQDDIQQFVMQEASQSSYQDEATVQTWAERVTSAFEAVTGETLPASTTATTSAIQSRSAQSQFSLIKEGIGMSLVQWLEDQALPIINTTVKKGDIQRLTLKSDELAEFNENIANELLLRQMKKTKGIFDPEQIERERQRIIKRLNSAGADKFIKLLKEVDLTEYDLSIHITNEKIDKGVLAQNLIQTLQLTGNIQGLPQNVIIEQIRQVYDTLGLSAPNLPSSNQPIGGEIQDNRALTGATSQPEQVTRANTPRQV